MASRPISPAEPTKKHPPPILPNAHPYAIKTTSSALLSRSNSSPHSAHHTRHHYVPSSPSRVLTGTRVRHRHSSSLSSVEGEVHGGMCTVPAPLPTPPSIVAASPDNPLVSLNRADEPKLSYQVRRAETISPISPTEPITEHHSYDQKHKYSQVSRPETYVGLPPNPKQWNTDELTTYLRASLTLGNNTDGDTDNSSLADILECVRTRGLTGRELLRLTDTDLAGTPLSDVQRVQLLERSRILRADVLRGRIYVDSYHSHQVSDNSNDIYSRSARSSTPFHNIYSASVSADDLRLLPDNNTNEGEGVFPPSPAMSLHRSNSVSDASAQRYRDLARMRMRRRGKVKGLVETWERASTSGSECSASEEGSVSGSEAESESETDPDFQSISDAKHSPGSPSDLPFVLHDEPLHDVCSSLADSTVVLQEPPSLTPPPPYTHVYTALGAVEGEEEEEPSIEELLASSSSIPLKGARAWEVDFGLGETVKRIPVSTSADADSASLVAEPDTSRPKHDGQKTRGNSVRSKGSGLRGSTGSTGKSAKTQKRVVTAIFTGSSSDGVPENVGDEMNLVGHHRHANGVNAVVCDKVPATSDLQNDSDGALRALEESIAATRAQMDGLRLRLEVVEADTARQEAVLERAQYSDSRCSSEFELRQRRSETNKQAAAETAELPRDETLVEGDSNRDVLEAWETMPLGGVARTIVAKAMGWLFPYGRLGVPRREDQERSQARAGSRPGVKNRYPSPAKRYGRLLVVRMSCSIILVSFAICAAVLRRLGFGRWARRP
ncbi:hypothetical protein J3R83DRAFT_12477 [Lanmaoa asiatica]|nr:hypothetical protein J3R83DRAFT_12477 [Lanmaoa asiatica]